MWARASGDSFGSDSSVWKRHLKKATEDEREILEKLIAEESKKINLEYLETVVKSFYDSVKEAIEEGETLSLSITGFFSYAILGRLAFELRSDCMADGAFLYGLWLTMLPYHASTELDVTLEPRQSRQTFDEVLGKNSMPAFIFHTFYYSGAGNTTFAMLERVHRRSGMYWMRLAKNLALDSYPTLKYLDRALGLTDDGEQLTPLEYYHRHFLDDTNSNGEHVKNLFPKRDTRRDFDYLLLTELPTEFPISLKSYQLSVYFKLLMSDPHLSSATRKECLRTIESFSDPRFEWVKSSSLLPLTRWTTEIHRFHKKPFALELHHMFYPLITQSASGVLGRMKEHILRYLRDGKIGTIKVDAEESSEYVASLMLRNLEFLAIPASNEELPVIAAQLKPLSKRLDTLINVEAKYQSNRTQNFKQSLGRYIQGFIIAAIVGDTTKLQLREQFRKPGQPIELVDAKKSSLSKTLYSIAFDSNILELISFAYPGAAGAILTLIAVSKGISAGSVEDTVTAVIDHLPIDEEVSETIKELSKFTDIDVKWFNKNSKWLEHFPYASDLLNFYKQCTSWSKDKSYKLSTSINGMAYLNDMLNSVRPGGSFLLSEEITQTLHSHYLTDTEKLSLKSQQLFADAIAHAILGGLIARHKQNKSPILEEGSDKLYDILHECINVHGNHILALAPPLLSKDGTTTTAKDIVKLSNLRLAKKQIISAIEQLGMFKPAPVNLQQESADQQLTNCGSTLDISSP